MRKAALLALGALLIVLSSVGHGQVTSSAVEWEVFRSERLKFQIAYPSGWKFQEVNAEYLVISPAIRDTWAHGVGLPPPPNPWFEIRLLEGNCSEMHIVQNRDFVAQSLVEGSSTSFYDRVACRSERLVTAVIYLGYWESDPDKAETRKILEAMLESFKII